MQRFGDWIVCDCVDEADLKSAMGVDFLSCDEEFERSCFPDQTRQTLRSAPTCDESESRAAMAKYRAGRGNSTMANEREIESSAEAWAFDRGDHESGKGSDRVHQSLSHLRERAGFACSKSRDLVEVSSDAEELTIAGDDERARVVRENAYLFCEGENASACEAICVIGRREAKNVCVARSFDFEKFAGLSVGSHSIYRKKFVPESRSPQRLKPPVE